MPFLSDSELDALLEQLPALAGQPRQLEELSGGLTNRNVKITTPSGAYVARCSVNSKNLLGIDRDNEYYNSRAAAEAELARRSSTTAPTSGSCWSASWRASP